MTESGRKWPGISTARFLTFLFSSPSSLLIYSYYLSRCSPLWPHSTTDDAHCHWDCVCFFLSLVGELDILNWITMDLVKDWQHPRQGLRGGGIALMINIIMTNIMSLRASTSLMSPSWRVRKSEKCPWQAHHEWEKANFGSWAGMVSCGLISKTMT